MRAFNQLVITCLYLLFLFILPTGLYAGQTATAIFAMGCFWCAQHDFDQIPGVVNTIVGYTGGQLENPTYAQVSEGGTGHYESIQVIYNPGKVGYEQLLTVFWKNSDPLDANGQFCDKGDQYRAVIFYSTNEEKKLADTSKAMLINSGRFKEIATHILPATTFYPAEEYHQKYYLKNPVRYKFYRYNCGRDQRLEKIWG